MVRSELGTGIVLTVNINLSQRPKHNSHQHSHLLIHVYNPTHMHTHTRKDTLTSCSRRRPHLGRDHLSAVSSGFIPHSYKGAASKASFVATASDRGRQQPMPSTSRCLNEEGCGTTLNTHDLCHKTQRINRQVGIPEHATGTCQHPHSQTHNRPANEDLLTLEI